MPAVRPADPRGPRGAQGAPRAGAAGAAVPVRIALAGGVWLVAAPLVLGYSTTGTGFRAYWNDIAVGLAVIAVLTPRVAVPARAATALTAVALALGGWLALAPFALGFAGTLARATVNDVLVGVALALLAGLALTR